jgi:uncharacterized protein (TIGR03437 family)
MIAPTTQHPATLLFNGKVLVVGSLSCNPGCFSGFTAQLYDPASGVWTVTGLPHVPRFNHIAQLLPNGKVLVGSGYVSPGVLTASAELYDPTTGKWSFTGSLATARQFHTSAPLPGGKVLVAGGLGMDGQGSFLTLSSAEVYDPATGQWSPAGNMSVPRWSHSMTALSDGRVLVAGGFGSTSPSAQNLQSAELYDPVAGTWTPATNLVAARANHRAVLLPDGQVLVMGGEGLDQGLMGAELYDPVADRWSVTGSTSGPRIVHTLTLLPNGMVLAAGGWDYSMVLSNSEIYDPSSGLWSPAADLTQAREYQSATLLQSGKVLIAGGANGSGGVNRGLTSSEVFGVSSAPAGGVLNVSAASFLDNGAVAPESLTAAFGSNLASATLNALGSSTLPLNLGGVSVTVQDSTGTARQAPILAVSPGQVNYQIPSGTAGGTAAVTINQGSSAVASGSALIKPVTPGLFSADGSGQGLAAAVVQRIHSDGTQGYEPVAQFDSTQQRFVAVPIDLSSPTDQVFLLLFGTGIRFRSGLSAVSATIGPAMIGASFASPSPQFPGLDQVNLLLPPALAGTGEVEVSLSVDGLAANPVLLSIE